MVVNKTTPKPRNGSKFIVEFAGQKLTAHYSSMYEILIISNGHSAWWEFVDTIYDQTKIIEHIPPG